MESVASGRICPPVPDMEHIGVSNRGSLHTERIKSRAVWAKMNDHEPLNLKPVHFHLATAVKLETKSGPDCQSKSTMVGTVGRRARGSRAEAT